MTANGPNTIGPETQVVGTIIGSEPLQVEGQVDGKIQVDGTVVVAASGRVKAEIEAREVVVEGYLEGKLTATAPPRASWSRTDRSSTGICS